jgi:branched-chain amino acid transport system substrate-binding protein
MIYNRSIARTVAVCLTAGALAVLSACSSSTSTTGGGAPAAAHGSVATGSPITIGFTTVANDPAVGDYSMATDGAQAAVRYINNNGGIAGRPIKLDVCTTTASSGGAACANQFVAAKVPIVLVGLLIQTQQMFTILGQAGIPIISVGINGPADYLNTGTHWSMIGSIPVQEPVIAADAAKNGAKKVAAVFENFPGVQTQEAAMKKAFANQGVTDVKIFTAAGNSSDYLSTLAAANSDKPDTMFIGLTNCVRAMTEVKQLGITAQTYYFSGCYDGKGLKAAGSAANGVKIVTELLTKDIAPDNKDVKIFVSAMADAGYADLDKNQWAGFGFQNVMVFKQAADAVGVNSLTAKAINEYLATSKNVPLFLGTKYSCAQPPVTSAKALCSAAGRIVQIEDGKPVDASGGWIHVSDQTAVAPN